MDYELRLARLEAEFDAFCDRRDVERKVADNRLVSLERAANSDTARTNLNLAISLRRVVDIEIVIQALLLELEPMAPGLTERVSRRLLEETERLADQRREGETARENALQLDSLAVQMQRLAPQISAETASQR